MKKIASLLFIILIGVAVGADAAAKARKFYLTQNTFTGSQALTACADGYHMASLWEILDPSNLRYDTTFGFSLDDSGFGPPTALLGWIRTGFVEGASGSSGSVNCNAWTSDSFEDFGSRVHLNNVWQDQSTGTSPWKADTFTCDETIRVWCVQD